MEANSNIILFVPQLHNIWKHITSEYLSSDRFVLKINLRLYILYTPNQQLTGC